MNYMGATMPGAGRSGEYPLSSPHPSAGRRTRKHGRLVATGIGVFALLLVFCSHPALAAAPTYNVLVGTDRYHTAQLISRAMFPGALPAGSGVVVAPGDSFPEALCGAPLAAAYGGPVLLTQKTGLDIRTKAELQRLAPSSVFCIGLSPTVFAAVRAALPSTNVISITGTDVYDMSYKVAKALRDKVGDLSAATAIITIGTNYPDALGVSPLACAKLWPILLTGNRGALHPKAAQALSELGITGAIKVGTYVGLPAGVAYVANLSGRDRYATNANVAAWAQANAGLSFTRLAFATGDKFPDALAAGPYLAREGGILLLTAPSSVPQPISATVTAHVSEVERISFIGLGSTAIWQLCCLLPVSNPPYAPQLRTGSTGPAVLWLERKLASLTYRPGPVDGVYDEKTYQAVIAFQKWEGLGRDGAMASVDWAKLYAAVPPTARRSGTAAWIEIDKTRQLLLYVNDDLVVRTLACSTGSGRVGDITPSGSFAITSRFPGWQQEGVFDACVFTPAPDGGSVAIHGSNNVPTSAATHGCVRLTVWDMTELFPQLGIGKAVFVY
jgi:hypothetical protein